MNTYFSISTSLRLDQTEQITVWNRFYYFTLPVGWKLVRQRWRMMYTRACSLSYLKTRLRCYIDRDRRCRTQFTGESRSKRLNGQICHCQCLWDEISASEQHGIDLKIAAPSCGVLLCSVFSVDGKQLLHLGRVEQSAGHCGRDSDLKAGEAGRTGIQSRCDRCHHTKSSTTAAPQSPEQIWIAALVNNLNTRKENVFGLIAKFNYRWSRFTAWCHSHEVLRPQWRPETQGHGLRPGQTTSPVDRDHLPERNHRPRPRRGTYHPSVRTGRWSEHWFVHTHPAIEAHQRWSQPDRPVPVNNRWVRMSCLPRRCSDGASTAWRIRRPHSVPRSRGQCSSQKVVNCAGWRIAQPLERRPRRKPAKKQHRVVRTGAIWKPTCLVLFFQQYSWYKFLHQFDEN